MNNSIIVYGTQTKPSSARRARWSYRDVDVSGKKIWLRIEATGKDQTTALDTAQPYDDEIILNSMPIA